MYHSFKDSYLEEYLWLLVLFRNQEYEIYINWKFEWFDLEKEKENELKAVDKKSKNFHIQIKKLNYWKVSHWRHSSEQGTHKMAAVCSPGLPDERPAEMLGGGYPCFGALMAPALSLISS